MEADRDGRRYYAGTALSVIDGVPRPPFGVTIVFGGEEPPVFWLASGPGEPGGLLWIVSDHDDADVLFETATGQLTVRLGPEHAPAALPSWSGPDPRLPSFSMPRSADTALASFRVSASGLEGAIALTEEQAVGGPTRLDATITAQPTSADLWGQPVTSPEPKPPAADLAEPDYRRELRLYGQALALRRRFDEAAPVLAEAATLYEAAAASARNPRSDLISLSMIIDYQIRCAQQASGGPDYQRFIGHLTDMARLRRAMSVGPAATGDWRRFRASTLDQLGRDREPVAMLAGLVAPPLRDLLVRADQELASAGAALSQVVRSPANPDQFAACTGQTERLLTATADALRAITGDIVCQDAHLLGDAHPLRAARQELLALLSVLPGADGQEIHIERISELDRVWHERLAVLPGLTEADTGLARAVMAAAVLVTGAAQRCELASAHLRRLDLPARARWWRAQDASALARLNRHVEHWRADIEGDMARIDAMENARPVHRELVTTLLDIDAVPDALAASEMARARAFADIFAAGRQTAPLLTPHRLRSAVSAYGQPLVEYFLAGDRLLIFSVRPDGTIETADTEIDVTALNDGIERLHRLVRPQDQADAEQRHASGEDQAETRALLRSLGRMLWDPIPWLPEDRDTPVMLVLHEQLLRVPFTALIDSAGRRVVDEHTTSVLPTAAILPSLTARARARRTGPSSLYALVAPEPTPDFAALDLLAARFGSVSSRYGSTWVRYGRDATPEALREVAERQPTVVCLATHAQALEQDPMGSFVVLAAGHGHDGRLRARDVYGLDLPTQLVILAACDTGAGRITSDGVVGLSRAFLAAGPQALMMTLWPVAPRDTLRVLSRFHDHYLGGGAGPAAALRAAQADQARRYADDPRRWAAFTVFGLPD